MTLNNENYNISNYEPSNLFNEIGKNVQKRNGLFCKNDKHLFLSRSSEGQQQFYQNNHFDNVSNQFTFLREVAKIRFNQMSSINNIDRVDTINKVLAILREKTKQIAKNQLEQYKNTSEATKWQFLDRQQLILALQRKSMRLEDITQKYAQLHSRYNELDNKNKQLETKYLKLKRKHKHIQKKLLETTKQQMFNQSTIFNLKGQIQLIKLQSKKDSISCISHVDQQHSPNVLEFYIPKKQQPTEIQQDLDISKNISCTELKPKPPLYKKFGYVKTNRNNSLNLSQINSSIDSIKNPKFQRKPLQNSQRKNIKNDKNVM